VTFTSARSTSRCKPCKGFSLAPGVFFLTSSLAGSLAGCASAGFASSLGLTLGCGEDESVVWAAAGVEQTSSTTTTSETITNQQGKTRKRYTSRFTALSQRSLACRERPRGSGLKRILPLQQKKTSAIACFPCRSLVKRLSTNVNECQLDTPTRVMSMQLGSHRMR